MHATFGVDSDVVGASAQIKTMVDKEQLDNLVGSLGGSPDDKARKIGQLSERVDSLDVELKTRLHPPINRSFLYTSYPFMDADRVSFFVSVSVSVSVSVFLCFCVCLCVQRCFVGGCEEPAYQGVSRKDSAPGTPQVMSPISSK
jgi:hypothetical protein